MKKIILSLTLAVMAFSTAVVAQGLETLLLKSSVQTVYVDTGQRAVFFASISGTKINVPAAVTVGEGDSLALNTQKSVVLTTIADAGQKSTLGQNLFLADHRLGSDSLKSLATYDASQFLQQISASGAACTLVSVSYFNSAGVGLTRRVAA